MTGGEGFFETVFERFHRGTCFCGHWIVHHIGQSLVNNGPPFWRHVPPIGAGTSMLGISACSRISTAIDEYGAETALDETAVGDPSL